MLRQQKRRPLHGPVMVEALERRLVLAVTVDPSGGNLIIQGDNQANEVIITYVGGTTFSVANVVGGVGTPLGDFDVTGSIGVSMGNNADVVRLNLGGNVLPGSLFISTGLGNDQVHVDNGTIAGPTTLIAAGAGNDVINVGLNGKVTINSASVTFRGGLGEDTLNLLNGSDLPGAVTIVDVNSVNLGVDLSGPIFGSVAIRYDAPALNNSTILGDGTVVNGDVTYRGAALADSIILDADVFGTADIDAGDGENTLRTSVIGDTTINRLRYRGGSGVDGLLFSASGTTHFLENVTLETGDGENVYLLSNAFQVGGNLTMTAGSGRDNFGTVGATVGGDLIIHAGIGGDSAATPQTFTLPATSAVGRNFVWTSLAGGTGAPSIDQVTLAGTIAGSAIVALGAGADVLTVALTAIIGGTLFAHFGADADVDVFNLDPGAIIGSVVVVNLP